MYSNQTETIGLPQYEGSDKLQRADLNGAFAALDTAVKERPAANADGKYPAAVLADTAANVNSGGLADTRIKAVEDALPGKASLGADGKLADGQTPAAAKVSLTAPTGMTGKNVQAGINELAGRFGAGGAANNALKLGGTPAADFALQTDMTTVKGYFTNGAAKNALKLGNTEAARYGTTETAELTLLNGWTYADNAPAYSPKACRCGNVVTINGVIKGGNIEAWTQLFVLPAPMRPKSAKYISSACYGGHCTYFINPQGAVSVVLFRADAQVHLNCAFGLD